VSFDVHCIDRLDTSSHFCCIQRQEKGKGR